MASPGLMHDTGCLGLVYWDDPEGWDGEGGGRRVLMRNTCTLMEDSSQSMAKPIQYCKVILIIIFFNLKKFPENLLIFLTPAQGALPFLCYVSVLILVK